MSEIEEKVIEIVDCFPGYAHTRYQGTCSANVTVADIEKRIYHSYFGGREAWVRDGRWGAVCHTD